MSTVNTECHPFHTTKIQNARYVQATAHSTPLKSRLVNAVESTNSTTTISWDTSSINGSTADPSHAYQRFHDLKTDYAWLTLEFEFEGPEKKTDSQEPELRSCNKAAVASRCWSTTRTTGQPAEKPLADKKRKRDATTSEDDLMSPSSRKRVRSSSYREENETTAMPDTIPTAKFGMSSAHGSGSQNPRSVPSHSRSSGCAKEDILTNIDAASDWEIPTITIVPASPRDPAIEYANCANGGMPQDPAFLMTPDVQYTASSEEDDYELQEDNLGEAGEKVDELDAFWEWSLS